jgi:hypothetical protein
LVRTNLVPDWLIRLGVRVILRTGTRRLHAKGLEVRDAERRALIEKLKQSPIAIPTDNANRQHYEVPLHFQRDLRLVDHWRVSGTSYAKALPAWLEKLDRHRLEVRKILARTFGRDQETCWLVNWWPFFMACEETWGLRNGREYLVSHSLFEGR